jgi:ketosteroid isomerase-like protein
MRFIYAIFIPVIFILLRLPMMHKKYILCWFLLFASCTLFAQDRQAIIKLMKDDQAAWNRGDIDGFMQAYWKSDSVIFIGKTGPLYGWQSTLNRYKKAYPGKAAMGKLTFGIIKLNVLDKTNAFMLGSWHLQRKAGALGGHFTLWFRKIGGEWKIVCDHTS